MLGVISFGIASAAYLFLTALLAVSWRGRPIGARLIVASAATSLWALVLATESGGGRVPLLAIYLAELLCNGAWIYALFGLIDNLLPRWLRYAAVGLWLALLIVGIAAPVILSGDPAENTLLVSRATLVLALIGLLLIEQIYRNASHAGRYALRYFVIGVGGMFAYDLFVFSHAEMLQAIAEPAWIARGTVATLAVPFVALAVRRNPDWSLDIFISRQAVFYTSTFVAVGVYMVAMALGGYIVRDLGGTWGTVGQIMFLVGAVAVLATLVASATLRRHFTVFISKHFYSNKYDYRIEWLRFIETLSSTEDEDVRRTAVRAVAQIFRVPAQFFSLARSEGIDLFRPSPGRCASTRCRGSLPWMPRAISCDFSVASSGLSMWRSIAVRPIFIRTSSCQNGFSICSI